jgi:hypothetical protein
MNRRQIDRVLLQYFVAVLIAIETEDIEELEYLYTLLPLVRILTFLRDLQ